MTHGRGIMGIFCQNSFFKGFGSLGGHLEKGGSLGG
jgi:hypothetical protein